jgi:hypothetical protein
MVVLEEKRRRLFLLLGLYMFLYMLLKHVVDIQTLILQGEWRSLQLGFGEYGTYRKERMESRMDV